MYELKERMDKLNEAINRLDNNYQMHLELTTGYYVHISKKFWSIRKKYEFALIQLREIYRLEITMMDQEIEKHYQNYISDFQELGSLPF